jgi:hypothetical protein
VDELARLLGRSSLVDDGLAPADISIEGLHPPESADGVFYKTVAELVPPVAGETAGAMISSGGERPSGFWWARPRYKTWPTGLLGPAQSGPPVPTRLQARDLDHHAQRARSDRAVRRARALAEMTELRIMLNGFSNPCSPALQHKCACKTPCSLHLARLHHGPVVIESRARAAELCGPSHLLTLRPARAARASGPRSPPPAKSSGTCG